MTSYTRVHLGTRYERQGTPHLGQSPETPRSNRAAVLEDEIDCLKAEHCAKLLEVEETNKARQAEVTQSVELLQKKALQLQNQVITLETALFHVKESLAAERTEWESERARLTSQNAQLRDELDTSVRERSNSGRGSAESPQTQQLALLERELQHIRNELVRVSTQEEDAQRAAVSARDCAMRLTSELDTHVQQLASHHLELTTLRQQAASAHEREAALAQELVGLRERNNELQRKLNQLQLQSAPLQQHAEMASRLSDAEATSEALSRENRSIAGQLARLQTQFVERTRAMNANASASGGVFAVHVELKRENQQLRAQVEELKQLQRRFLTTAKKTTMSFPAI